MSERHPDWFDIRWCPDGSDIRWCPDGSDHEMAPWCPDGSDHEMAPKGTMGTPYTVERCVKCGVAQVGAPWENLIAALEAKGCKPRPAEDEER